MDHPVPLVYEKFINVDSERASMSKGRIVKARFPDQLAPNVSWFWIPIGNCAVCRYYQPPSSGRPLECAHPRVSTEAFHRYMLVNTCPYHETGENPTMESTGYERNLLDVMRAIGLVPGTPGQRVEILQNLAWTPARSQRAHGQQIQFVQMAWEADRGVDYGDHQERVMSHSDDLGPIYEHEGEVPEDEV